MIVLLLLVFIYLFILLNLRPDLYSSISAETCSTHPDLFTWTVDELRETRLRVIDSINASHYHFIFAKAVSSGGAAARAGADPVSRAV